MLEVGQEFRFDCVAARKAVSDMADAAEQHAEKSRRPVITEALVAGCQSILSRPVLSSPRANELLAAALLLEVSSLNGYSITFTTEEMTTLVATLRSAADGSAKSAMATIDGWMNAQPGQLSMRYVDPGEPIRAAGVRAYIISALTGLEPDEHDRVVKLSSIIAKSLDRFAITTHEPARHTDPNEQPDLDPSDVHRVDYAAVMNSDLVVVIGDHPSWGGGKELAWADAAGAQVIVLSGAGTRLSRLVTGTTGTLVELPCGDATEVDDVLENYIRSELVNLVAHARWRAGRPAQFEALAGVLEEAIGNTQIPGLTSSRLEEMLSSPAHLANATLDEIARIRVALGTHVVDQLGEPYWMGLRPDEIAALEDAQALEGWSLSEAASLMAVAAGGRQLGAKKRFKRLRDPKDWIELKKSS